MNAVGSVASLEWIWRIHDPDILVVRPNLSMLLRVETISAKEDTGSIGCLGKLLGCRNWMSRGLQCGLSGSPATICVSL